MMQFVGSAKFLIEIQNPPGTKGISRNLKESKGIQKNLQETKRFLEHLGGPKESSGTLGKRGES